MIHDSLAQGHEYTVVSLAPISAWSILFAGKDVENRSEPTTQRGRVLIHASNEGISLREAQARRAEVSVLAGLPASALPTIFPRRTILGSVEIVDCVEDARSRWSVAGKFHWVLRDPRPLLSAVEDIDAEPAAFWRWTYRRAANLSPKERRAPTRSGIVAAVRVSDADLAQAAAAQTASRRRR